MGHRTYEADKEGRINIYPSLYSSKGKDPGIIKILIKNLFDVVIGIRKKPWEINKT